MVSTGLVNQIVTVAEELPAWLSEKAAANSNTPKTVAELAAAYWASRTALQAAAESAAMKAGQLSALGAGAAGLTALVFATPIAFAARSYLTHQTYFDNRRFTPCGTEPRKPAPSHAMMKDIPNYSRADNRVHDFIGYNALRFYAESFARVPAVDNPRLGSSVEQYLRDIKSAQHVSEQMLEKRREIMLAQAHGQSDRVHLLQNELNSLATQIQTIGQAYPVVRGGLRIMNSADAAGANSTPAMTDAKDDEDVKNKQRMREDLNYALMLPDCATRATMLTGFAGTFARYGHWDLFQVAVDNAIKAANALIDKTAAMQVKRDLMSELHENLPVTLDKIPPPQVRAFLSGVVTSEMPAAKLDARYMTGLTGLRDTLEGWSRIMQASAPLSVNALAALATVEPRDMSGGVLQHATAKVDKTPLPVDLVWQKSAEEAAGLIRIGDASMTYAKWMSYGNKVKGGVWTGLVSAEIVAVTSAIYFDNGFAMFGSALFGIIQLAMAGHSLKRIFGDIDESSLQTTATDGKFRVVIYNWYKDLQSALTRGAMKHAKLMNRKKGTFLTVNVTWQEILATSVKTVSGKTYNLVQFMDMDPFWKKSQEGAKFAQILPAIEKQGRVWSEVDLKQIAQLQIKWDRASVTAGDFTKIVEWLAAHGNESVVRWVHREATIGVPKAQEVFEKLVAADNHLALQLLSQAHDAALVSIIPLNK